MTFLTHLMVPPGRRDERPLIGFSQPAEASSLMLFHKLITLVAASAGRHLVPTSIGTSGRSART